MTENERQNDYWDANLDARNLGGVKSDSPESLLEELKYSSVPDIQEMIDYVRPAPGRIILEIGSGLGANAVLLGYQGATVLALDLSHERLVALRKRTGKLPGKVPGGIIPIKARAEALPFRENSLDGACSRAVLIHTDLSQACRETARVLKPSAPFAFSEPMAHNPLVKIYRWTLAPKEWRGITTYFTKRQINEVTSHFSDCQTHGFYMLTFVCFAFQYAIPSPQWFYASLVKFTGVDDFIRKYWRGYERFAWFALITGRKPDAP